MVTTSAPKLANVLLSADFVSLQWQMLALQDLSCLSADQATWAYELPVV